MRILLIEDQKRLSDSIKKGLTEEGFAVDQAFDGEEGLFLGVSETYDVIILDLMLPKKDGLTVCRELREKGIRTAILMLTAKTRVNDRVAGLESGADDYLSKPFAFIELKARIQALMRRSLHHGETVLSVSDLCIDPRKHRVTRGNAIINLTPKEFSILEFLVRHKDEVVTRTQIIEHVWDYNFDSMSNVVDVFIRSLRRKIDQGNSHKLIQTIHGVGYKVEGT